MNKIVLILLMFLFMGCEPVKIESKRVKLVAKKEELGSHYNPLTGKQVFETTYYLVFDNGQVETVDLSTYILSKEGTYFNVKQPR